MSCDLPWKAEEKEKPLPGATSLYLEGARSDGAAREPGAVTLSPWGTHRALGLHIRIQCYQMQ